MVQCGEAFGSGGHAPVAPGLAEPAAIAGCQRADDRPGDFVLDREDIRQLPVIDFGPKLPALGSVDKLDADALASSALRNAEMWTCSVFSSTTRLGQTAFMSSVLEITASGLSSNKERMSKDRAESSPTAADPRASAGGDQVD